MLVSFLYFVNPKWNAMKKNTTTKKKAVKKNLLEEEKNADETLTEIAESVINVEALEEVE